MTRAVNLRPWQKAAFDLFTGSTAPDFLAVATPGAGKTTFALAAARHELGARPGRLIVVAPTAHLKSQWAGAALGFGLHLDPAWSPQHGLSADLHGIVTTYQQVASAAPSLRTLAADAVVVLDEVHHAADERAWGDSIRVAFSDARRRLALSGTPFRSDTSAIPFVDYVLDEARPDYTYGYADALRDRRVVRPVYFPRVGGQMEWVAPDGSEMSASFDDALDNPRAAQRLRTALSLDGQWLPTVLRSADQRLRSLRAQDPDTGGLVIATDQAHARGIADLMRWHLGVEAVVVTSDDPTASARIARFAGSRDPWLVAVRMVSEGVDIPRLAVGVFATTTTTELFFRQAVGRLVRWRSGLRRQQAFLYLPDDARLRTRAFQIADERRHSLRRPDEDAEDMDADLGDIDDDEAIVVEFPALPPLAGGGSVTTATIGRVEHKRLLRLANAQLAQELALIKGLDPRRVNAELNRRAGIAKVAQASIEELERRLAHAESWFAAGGTGPAR